MMRSSFALGPLRGVIGIVGLSLLLWCLASLTLDAQMSPRRRLPEEARHTPLAGGEGEGGGGFPRPNKTLAVMSVFKQETMTMKEWLDHYLWQGVDHFFLVDNNSTDDPLAILEPYIRSGLVTYSFHPKPHDQVAVLRKVFTSREAQAYEWIIDADLDEFWFAVRRGSTLKSELTDPSSPLAKADVIAGNWLMFGTSGAIEHPVSVRRTNIHRWPKPDWNTKWIARTSALSEQQVTLHWWEGMGNAVVRVDDDDRIRIHHYCLQSREFFEKAKMARGDATSDTLDGVRSWDYFRDMGAKATLEDRTLADLLDPPRESVEPVIADPTPSAESVSPLEDRTLDAVVAE